MNCVCVCVCMPCVPSHLSDPLLRWDAHLKPFSLKNSHEVCCCHSMHQQTSLLHQQFPRKLSTHTFPCGNHSRFLSLTRVILPQSSSFPSLLGVDVTGRSWKITPGYKRTNGAHQLNISHSQIRFSGDGQGTQGCAWFTGWQSSWPEVTSVAAMFACKLPLSVHVHSSVNSQAEAGLSVVC